MSLSLVAVVLSVLALLPFEGRAQSLPSPYVSGHLPALEAALAAVAGGPPSTPCPDPNLEINAIQRVGDILLGAEQALREGSLDLTERSACFQYDIWRIEDVIESAVVDYLDRAEVCDVKAMEPIDAILVALADLLLAVRKGGLNPDFGRPPGDPPGGATDVDDDLLCPYHSAYAVPTLQDFQTLVSWGKGCSDIDLPLGAEAILHEEAQLLDRITERFVDSSPLAPPWSFLDTAEWYRLLVMDIRNLAQVFVTNLSSLVGTFGGPFPDPPTPFPPDLYGGTGSTIGESGCRGWPTTSTEGVVRGEGYALARRGHSPFLDPALRRMLAFLEEALTIVANLKDLDLTKRPNEYLLTLRRQLDESRGSATGSSLTEDVAAVLFLNSLFAQHVEEEAAFLLSIQDGQARLRQSLRPVHALSREVARSIVPLPGEIPPADGPPWRGFLGKFLLFLSQMCPNRGCSDAIMRAYELSLRDECYPYFLFGTGSTPLPLCAARYVPP